MPALLILLVILLVIVIVIVLVIVIVIVIVIVLVIVIVIVIHPSVSRATPEDYESDYESGESSEVAVSPSSSFDQDGAPLEMKTRQPGNRTRNIRGHAILSHMTGASEICANRRSAQTGKIQRPRKPRILPRLPTAARGMLPKTNPATAARRSRAHRTVVSLANQTEASHFARRARILRDELRYFRFGCAFHVKPESRNSSTEGNEENEGATGCSFHTGTFVGTCDGSGNPSCFVSFVPFCRSDFGFRVKKTLWQSGACHVPPCWPRLHWRPGLIQENGAPASIRPWFNDPPVAHPSRLEIGAPSRLAGRSLFFLNQP